MRKVALWLPLIILLANCSTTKPLSSSYYKAKTKTGLVVIVRPLENVIDEGVSRSVGGTIANKIINSSERFQGKYAKAFIAIEPQLKAAERLRHFYVERFARNGKKVTPFDEYIDLDALENYTPPADWNKVFFKARCGESTCCKDLRYLKKKLDVDELMLVTLRYGINSGYHYAIEVSREGMASLTFQIIDLNDNSIVYASWATKGAWVDDDWDTPPTYENIKTRIDLAIEEVLKEEQEKY